MTDDCAHREDPTTAAAVVHIGHEGMAVNGRPWPDPHLRALRVAAGLTQRQVADALGLAPSAYADIERGRRKLRDRHVDALAAALGVDREAVRPTCPVCGR